MPLIQSGSSQLSTPQVEIGGDVIIGEAIDVECEDQDGEFIDEDIVPDDSIIVDCRNNDEAKGDTESNDNVADCGDIAEDSQQETEDDTELKGDKATDQDNQVSSDKADKEDIDVNSKEEHENLDEDIQKQLEERDEATTGNDEKPFIDSKDPGGSEMKEGEEISVPVEQNTQKAEGDTNENEKNNESN